MLRTVLVVIHATAGIVGLLAGLAAITPARPTGVRQCLRVLYVACLAVLLCSLVALIVLDWRELALGARIAFTGLAGLGGVMGYRIMRAVRESAARDAGWQGRYLGHVYFTYISLWVGFLVIPALNLPYPAVSVPLVAVAVILVGNRLVSRYRKRVLSSGAGHDAAHPAPP